MVRYQQVYNKIPVMAGELIVNMKADGSLLSINGEVSPDLEVDVFPKVNAEMAEPDGVRPLAKEYNLKSSDLTVSKPELWIFDERLIEGDTMTARAPGLADGGHVRYCACYASWCW